MKPSFITRQALPAQVVGGDSESVHVAIRVRRLWLPFFVAEMVEPWWMKPVLFVWAAWHFWVRRVECL